MIKLHLFGIVALNKFKGVFSYKPCPCLTNSNTNSFWKKIKILLMFNNFAPLYNRPGAAVKNIKSVSGSHIILITLITL